MNSINEIPVVDEQDYQITIEDILGLLDKKYHLFYTDYGDNLNDSMAEIEKAIQNQDIGELGDNLYDWINDAQWSSIDYILKELAERISSEYDIEKDDAESLIEDNIDIIRDELYNRDYSDPIKELLRNTEEPVMFYDLDEEIYFDIPFGTEKEMKEVLHQIKKALKIKLFETKYDSQLKLLIQQGYNGKLVVYFRREIGYMLDKEDNNFIKIKNPHVAIIDMWNGAGDDTLLMGHEFFLPLDMRNVKLDKNRHYSYTYDVCGMNSSWCDETSISFIKKRQKRAKIA